MRWHVELNENGTSLRVEHVDDEDFGRLADEEPVRRVTDARPRPVAQPMASGQATQ